MVGPSRECFFAVVVHNTPHPELGRLPLVRHPEHLPRARRARLLHPLGARQGDALLHAQLRRGNRGRERGQ